MVRYHQLLLSSLACPHPRSPEQLELGQIAKNPLENRTRVEDGIPKAGGLSHAASRHRVDTVLMIAKGRLVAQSNAPNLSLFPRESEFDEQSLEERISAYPPGLFTKIVQGWTTVVDIVADTRRWYRNGI